MSYSVYLIMSFLSQLDVCCACAHSRSIGRDGWRRGCSTERVVDGAAPPSQVGPSIGNSCSCTGVWKACDYREREERKVQYVIACLMHAYCAFSLSLPKKYMHKCCDSCNNTQMLKMYLQFSVISSLKNSLKTDISVVFRQ